MTQDSGSAADADRTARYRNRSCSRAYLPCQNSTVSGTIRQPPQNGGSGTGSSSSAKRSCARACNASSAARSGSTVDCGLAQAPIRDPRGRLAQYSCAVSSDTLTTGPRIVHLPLQPDPGEGRRRPRVGLQVLALVRGQVRVEHHTGLVHALAQHAATGHLTGRGGRGHHHRVGFTKIRRRLHRPTRHGTASPNRPQDHSRPDLPASSSPASPPDPAGGRPPHQPGNQPYRC